MMIKQNLTCIPGEHKSFWQLSQLNDFIIANLFIHERLTSQRHIQNSVEYLRWNYLQK